MKLKIFDGKTTDTEFKKFTHDHIITHVFKSNQQNTDHRTILAYYESHNKNDIDTKMITYERNE